MTTASHPEESQKISITSVRCTASTEHPIAQCHCHNMYSITNKMPICLSQYLLIISAELQSLALAQNKTEKGSLAFLWQMENGFTVSFDQYRLVF